MLKNTGKTKTFISNNNNNYVNEIKWKADYDCETANLLIDLNDNGMREHLKVKMNNEELFDLLNTIPVNIPIDTRLKNDFLQHCNKTLIPTPNKIQLKPNKIQLKPNKIQLKPNKIQLKPNKKQLKPNKIQLKPNKIQLKPNKIQLKPNKIQLKPNKIQPATVRFQTLQKLSNPTTKTKRTTKTKTIKHKIPTKKSTHKPKHVLPKTINSLYL